LGTVAGVSSSLGKQKVETIKKPLNSYFPRMEPVNIPEMCFSSTWHTQKSQNKPTPRSKTNLFHSDPRTAARSPEIGIVASGFFLTGLFFKSAGPVFLSANPNSEESPF